MYSQVLVPLDGSAFSRQILPALCRLVPPQYGTVILLQVTEEPSVRPYWCTGSMRPVTAAHDGAGLPNELEPSRQSQP